MSKIKFVIISPRQRNSGGAVVLHELCRRLRLMGYDAKIYYTEYFNYSDRNVVQWLKYVIKKILFLIKDTFFLIVVKIMGKEKLKKYSFFNGYAYYQVEGCKRKIIPRVDDETIVVYPEVVRGNILHAKNVVRWFLYHNLYLHDKKDYGINDLFITFRDVFNDWELNPDGKKVYLTYYDQNLYKQTNYGERKGNCYIIRKGINRCDLPDYFDGPVIDDYSEIKKVEILNQCKYCYSYDTQTAYMRIAAMCGCIPIVMVERGKKREDYLKNDDRVYGVAYGDSKEEIKYAVQTKKKLFQELNKKTKDNEFNIIKFLEYCKDHFNQLPWN